MKEQFDQLMRQAASLPYGATKVALLEQAVRLADTHQDVKRGFEGRLELTRAANFSGKTEKAILAFGWCLAQYDKQPEAYDSRTVMWMYKWIVGSLDDFPEISREQIEAMLEDLRKRYAELGYSQRVYHKIKHAMARDEGDLEAAEREYELWQNEGRDEISDCLACERNGQVSYYLDEKNEFAEAYRLARPILDGQMRCRYVPHNTYASFLLPLLREGRAAEAAEFHERGYRLIHNESGHLWSKAKHLTYLAVVNPKRAMALLEKHLPEALDSYVPGAKFSLFLAASVLFTQLSEQEKQLLHLPAHVTEAWINAELRELARRFDSRNGTDSFSRRIGRRHAEVAELINHMRRS
ncbi:hypothetical protein [Laceyella putida]|uniref:Tetratricopeptide repeat protein n=1 Tax=Laceyella putida TaxID=110101 RepID=A0ABW2RFW8_9BACL